MDHKVKPKAKFDKKQPGAYVSKEAWKKMSEEERKQARDARQQSGIAVRNVSTLTSRTVAAARVAASPTSEPQMVNVIPGQAQVAAQLLMPPPPPKRVVPFETTRRVATYQSTQTLPPADVQE